MRIVCALLAYVDLKNIETQISLDNPNTAFNVLGRINRQSICWEGGRGWSERVVFAERENSYYDNSRVVVYRVRRSTAEVVWILAARDFCGHWELPL
jgi:hypothetical protein